MANNCGCCMMPPPSTIRCGDERAHPGGERQGDVIAPRAPRPRGPPASPAPPSPSLPDRRSPTRGPPGSRRETGSSPGYGSAMRSCGIGCGPSRGAAFHAAPPARQHSAADSRPDGEVQQVVQEPSRGAPPRLAEHRRVHVGVESRPARRARLPDLAREVDVLPPRLGSRGDVAPRRRLADAGRPARTSDPEPLKLSSSSENNEPFPRSSRPALSSGTESSPDPRGPVPTPQTNLVPPASIAPNMSCNILSQPGTGTHSCYRLKNAPTDRRTDPHRSRGQQAEADRRIHRRRQLGRHAHLDRPHAFSPRLAGARTDARIRRVHDRAERHATVSSTTGGAIEVAAGQAVHTPPGEWIRYSTPLEGAEYIAVCLPAFSPATVHRDD